MAETDTPFNEAERALLVHLLERERKDLAPEIHHTRTPTMHDELRQRLQLVESLLNRLRAARHA